MDKQDTESKIGEKAEVESPDVAVRGCGRPAWLGVEVCLALFLMVMAPNYGLMQQFLYSEIAKENNYTIDEDGQGYCGQEDNFTDTQKLQNLVQSETSAWMVYLELAETLPSVLMTLFLGPLSDRVGRRYILVLPLIGSTILCLGFLLISMFNLPYQLGIIGSFLNGLTGSYATFFSVGFAYLGDVTSDEKKVFRMTLADTIFSVASSCASIYMGYFISATGFDYPFAFLIALNIPNLLYIIFILPESINKSDESKPKETINPIKIIQTAIQTALNPAHRENRWKIWLIILANALNMFAQMGTMRFTAFYAMSTPLCWGSILLGYNTALSALVTNASKILLATFAIPRIKNIGGILLGLTSSGVSMLLQSVAVQTWIMFIVPLVGFAGALPMPVWRGMLSASAIPEEQGSLFSLMMLCERLFGMISGFIFNEIYSATLSTFRGTVFLVIAAVICIDIFLMMYYFIRERKENQISLHLDDIDITVDKKNNIKNYGSTECDNPVFYTEKF